MKKFSLTIMCVIFCLTKVQAQNDTILTIEQIWNHPGDVKICTNLYDRAIIYAPQNCTDFGFEINNQIIHESPVVLDKNIANIFVCRFLGCGYNNFHFGVRFKDPTVPAETTTELWKRQYEAITLEAPNGSYTYWWNTAATTATIGVIEPGTYTCGVSDMCATSVQTFIVRDNVELYRATVDLATGLNKVTWQTTPEQSEYISQVKVERDGMVVGTVPYMDGQFIDNIGSENAARNYRLTAITTEGEECPIPSYQKGTLHVDYSPNASNPNKLNMAWTPPFIEEGAPISVSYFQICKYDPTSGAVTVVDQLGANNTIGSYDISLFDGGYAVVAALFNGGRDYEEMSFSNLTEEILAVGENLENQIRVYPNPANGRFTAEGTGIMHITNVLGQEIMAKEIEGKETIELPQGLYFVKMNGVTRKIVVE